MAKSGSKKRNRSGAPQTHARKRAEKERRARIRRRNQLAVVAIVTVLLAAGVVATIAAVERSEEQLRDLSAVGQGVPAIVQVHDTTCPVCTQLRANIERIEDEFSDDELVIRLADVHSDEGLRFVGRYTTQRRVTLLFFDGDGELTDVQTGLQPVSQLRDTFTAHAATGR